jgi:hypothetical protein
LPHGKETTSKPKASSGSSQKQNKPKSGSNSNNKSTSDLRNKLKNNIAEKRNLRLGYPEDFHNSTRKMKVPGSIRGHPPSSSLSLSEMTAAEGLHK